MKDYYAITKEELNKRIDNFGKDYNKCVENEKIIEANRLENRLLPYVGGTCIFSFIINMICLALTGTHVLAVTEGFNYLIPVMNVIPIDIFPVLVMGASLLGGKFFSWLNEKISHAKARFNKVSKAKKEKAKIEEIINYRIKALQDVYRAKVTKDVLESLENDHSMFNDLDKIYDINNISMPQSYETTKSNIENLEKELEEKYKELDAIAAKKVLHDSFYCFRFFSNRFDRRFSNTIMWSLMTWIIPLLPFVTLGDAFKFTPIVRELGVFLTMIAGFAGCSAYFLKKDGYLLKTFKKKNDELGEDKLPKKPNKDRDLEEKEIFKNYNTVVSEACSLEIRLQEQKRIREIFEDNMEDDNEDEIDLNHNYSHANIPLMEFEENNTSKTYDGSSPIIKVLK